MPTVPTYDNMRVQESTLPDARLNAPDMSPEAMAGHQLEALGQSALQTGARVGSIDADMQNQANLVRVTDAMNQARAAAMNLTFDPQTGYMNQKGSAALDRPSGMALPEEYQQKLQQQLSQIGQGLGNDRQRLMFNQQAQALTTNFTSGVQQHLLREYQTYALNTQDGAIKLETNNAKLNWSNPDQIGQSLDRVRASVYQLGQLRGDPADLTQANMQSVVSNVHREVIQAALENGNPTYAMTYFGQNKGQMTADDILRTQGLVNQATWQQISMGAVQHASAGLTQQMAPSDFDRMVQITLGTESGGQRYGADGQLLTSSAGAKGEMQVMDGTNLNPGFGVKPAQDNSPAERARVGRDYLQAMLQRYGDPAKAWAAYNAGPGAVDAALKAAGPGGDWLAQLPTETENYVTNNLSQLQNPQPTARPQESDFVSAALQQLPPDAPPQLVKMTREAATQQFAVINKTFNEQRDNAVMDVQRALIGAGGDMSQVPATLLARVQQIAPDKYDDLVKFGRTISRGENNSDPATYLTLVSHPDMLAALSDADMLQLKTQLSNGDWDRFAKEREQLRSGQIDTGPQSINTAAVNTSLNNHLLSIGIEPTPGKSDMKGQQQVGAIQKFIRDGIFAQQAQTGQKMTPEQIDHFIDQQFAKSVTFRNTFLGFDTTKDSVPLLSMKIGDVPAADRAQITQALQSAGRPAPTDQDVLNMYWRRKARGG